MDVQACATVLEAVHTKHVHESFAIAIVCNCFEHDGTSLQHHPFTVKG